MQFPRAALNLITTLGGLCWGSSPQFYVPTFPWKYFFSMKWERSKEIKRDSKKRVVSVRGNVCVLMCSPEVWERPQAHSLECPPSGETHSHWKLPYNFKVFLGGFFSFVFWRRLDVSVHRLLQNWIRLFAKNYAFGGDINLVLDNNFPQFRYYYYYCVFGLWFMFQSLDISFSVMFFFFLFFFLGRQFPRVSTILCSTLIRGFFLGRVFGFRNRILLCSESWTVVFFFFLFPSCFLVFVFGQF